jgi:ABC-type multidrug transport system fused ATPase/permease subunit
MKPLMIISAMHWGHEMSMANVFIIIMMLDKLDWPMRMLPNFLTNVADTKRAFRRVQKVLMIDEVQKNLIG